MHIDRGSPNEERVVVDEKNSTSGQENPQESDGVLIILSIIMPSPAQENEQDTSGTRLQDAALQTFCHLGSSRLDSCGERRRGRV